MEPLACISISGLSLSGSVRASSSERLSPFPSLECQVLCRQRKKDEISNHDWCYTENKYTQAGHRFSFWFHKWWARKHWWCQSHTKGNALMKVDEKGILSRVSVHQQRKPTTMITAVQILDLIKTWSGTQIEVKMKCDQDYTRRNYQNQRNRTPFF